MVPRSMGDPFELRFAAPARGSLLVELSGPANVRIRFEASDRDGDPLGSLAAAALAILDGAPEARIEWSVEPSEETWILHRSRERIELWTGSETLRAVARGTPVEMCRPICDALDRLGKEPIWRDKAGWSHPFPTAAVETLKERLERGDR